MSSIPEVYKTYYLNDAIAKQFLHDAAVYCTSTTEEAKKISVFYYVDTTGFTLKHLRNAKKSMRSMNKISVKEFFSSPDALLRAEEMAKEATYYDAFSLIEKEVESMRKIKPRVPVRSLTADCVVWEPVREETFSKLVVDACKKPSRKGKRSRAASAIDPRFTDLQQETFSQSSQPDPNPSQLTEDTISIFSSSQLSTLPQEESQEYPTHPLPPPSTSPSFSLPCPPSPPPLLLSLAFPEEKAFCHVAEEDLPNVSQAEAPDSKQEEEVELSSQDTITSWQVPETKQVEEELEPSSQDTITSWQVPKCNVDEGGFSPSEISLTPPQFLESVLLDNSTSTASSMCVLPLSQKGSVDSTQPESQSQRVDFEVNTSTTTTATSMCVFPASQEDSLDATQLGSQSSVDGITMGSQGDVHLTSTEPADVKIPEVHSNIFENLDLSHAINEPSGVGEERSDGDREIEMEVKKQSEVEHLPKTLVPLPSLAVHSKRRKFISLEEVAACHMPSLLPPPGRPPVVPVVLTPISSVPATQNLFGDNIAVQAPPSEVAKKAATKARNVTTKIANVLPMPKAKAQQLLGSEDQKAAYDDHNESLPVEPNRSKKSRKKGKKTKAREKVSKQVNQEENEKQQEELQEVECKSDDEVTFEEEEEEEKKERFARQPNGEKIVSQKKKKRQAVNSEVDTDDEEERHYKQKQKKRKHKKGKTTRAEETEVEEAETEHSGPPVLVPDPSHVLSSVPKKLVKYFNRMAILPCHDYDKKTEIYCVFVYKPTCVYRGKKEYPYADAVYYQIDPEKNKLVQWLAPARLGGGINALYYPEDIDGPEPPPLTKVGDNRVREIAWDQVNQTSLITDKMIFEFVNDKLVLSRNKLKSPLEALELLRPDCITVAQYKRFQELLSQKA